MLTAVLFVITIALIAVGRIVFQGQHNRKRRSPPGPAPDFIIGHARKLPMRNSWQVFFEWRKLYGDVIHVYVPGRSIIILNSIQAARDLLDKKSANFSDRPYVPLINLMGWELTLPILPYGARFRKHRRIMHHIFGPQAIPALRPMQEHEIRKFLCRLIDNPEKFIKHIHSLVAGTISLVTYGHEVLSDNDKYVTLVDRAMYMTASSGTMGATIIDFIPLLRHMPSWMPGMKLKRLALETRKVVDQVMKVPFDEVKQRIGTNSEKPSIISRLIDEHKQSLMKDSAHEEDIMSVGATIYNAGTDTTKSVIVSFFLLMTIHSDSARAAQEEIDRVIGTDHLPCLEDRKSLPYIDCILKEVLRMHPPLPLGVPHQSIQPDTYRDWSIPDRAMTIANIWAMMRDETVFKEPDTFWPERHMDKFRAIQQQFPGHSKVDPICDIQTEDDPSSIVFGFGRRSCPGQYFADTLIWMTIANVLALFDIKPYVDPETGNTDFPRGELENEIILSPKPFKCTLTLRSLQRSQIVLEAAETQ